MKHKHLTRLFVGLFVIAISIGLLALGSLIIIETGRHFTPDQIIDFVLVTFGLTVVAYCIGAQIIE